LFPNRIISNLLLSESAQFNSEHGIHTPSTFLKLGRQKSLQE